MFISELPDVPALFVAASVCDGCGAQISATGVGNTPADARMRHDAEQAEKLALAAETCSGNRQGNADFAAYGSAAGRDGLAATTERAVLEMIERWACLAWWRGAVPPQSPTVDARAAFDRQMTCWARCKPRQSGLIQLNMRDMPPVCIAWSCDDQGRSLCFGTACRRRAPDAARSALKELLQMEFGLQVIHHRARHNVTLGRQERAIRARAARLRVETLAPLLRPRPTPPPMSPLPPEAGLLDILAAQGIGARIQEIATPDGTHQVVRATSPDFTVARAEPQAIDPGIRWHLYGAG